MSSTELALRAQEALSLQELITQIEAAHAEVISAVRGGFPSAAKAGKLLLEAKKRVRHGEWKVWLEKHVRGISPRTCRVYMQLATVDPTKWPNSAKLSMAKVLLSLAGKKPTRTRAIEPKRPLKTVVTAKPLREFTLSFVDASVDERRHLVDAIGFD